MDNMQLWLSSSTDSINLNDSAEGFYLNPDLEGLTGLPEIRSVNGLNAGYDGGWTATQLWAARLITIRGVIAINDKAAVETKRKALAKLLAQGKSEDLELKFVSEAGNTYTTTVRTTGCTMALQRVFWRQEYQIQLRANDPLIYDDGGSELVAILRVMAGEGGFEIPFDIPFTIGGSIEPTSVDVGDEATYPLIRLKGDLHNPTIINMTTNQRMQVLADIITTVEWRDYTTTYTTNGFAQISDGIDGAPLSLTHLYGNATQETLSGINMFDKDNLQSSTNTTVDSDGWATATYDNTGGSSSVFCNLINYIMPQIPEGTACSIVCEIKSVSGAGAINPISTNSMTQFSVNKQYAFSDVHAGDVIIEQATTKSDYTGVSLGNRPYVRYSVGESGSITYRISVIIGTSITPQNFVYQPYTGGVPMPNTQYPSEVKTVSGAQTVEIVGKNLWSSVWEQGSIDGSTGQNSPSNNAIRSKDYIRVKPNQHYAINRSISTQYTNVRCYDKSKNFLGTGTAMITYISGATGGNAGNPMVSGGAYCVIAPKDGVYYIRFTDVSNDLSTKYMMVQGDTQEDYEPYQSQSQVINLAPNLFDGTGTTADRRISTSTGGSYVASGYTISDYIAVSASTKYMLKTGISSHYSWYNSSKTYISGGDWTDSQEMTSPATASFVRFDFNSSDISKVRFEQIGSGIELAKISTYQDYIWNDNGTWKIHKEVGKVVFTGAVGEQWAGESYGGYWRANHTFSDISPITQNTDFVAFSDYFHVSINVLGAQSIGEGDFCQFRNTSTVYFAAPLSVQTSNDWRTWLSTHNTSVYYRLATPTDTEITDAELIEQLNHIYELYQGTNNVWLIPSAGAQGEIEVSYATTEDIDYHEVVIDCQARTVTQDGHNLYPALAEGSEFIRLLPGENKLYLTSEVESDNGTAEVKFKKGNISI